MKLSKRQLDFIDSYLRDGDGKKALSVAGYPVDPRRLYAMLNSPAVSAEITRRRLDQVPTALSDLAQPEGRAAWLRSVVMDDTQDMRNRLRAFELLAKASGDYVERREVRQAVVIKWQD